MHEALVTKGDAQKSPALKALLDRKENCVLVHPGGSGSKCHNGAATKDGQQIVLKHLIKWCGKSTIEAFIKEIETAKKGVDYVIDIE